LLLPIQKHLATYHLSENRNMNTHKFITSIVFLCGFESYLSLCTASTLIVFEDTAEENMYIKRKKQKEIIMAHCHHHHHHHLSSNIIMSIK